MLQGSARFTSTLKAVNVSGTQIGSGRSWVLAGGHIYASESAADAAGSERGRLSAPTISADLTGTGHPTALIGSEDGYLYALNPCSGTLDFVHNLEAPVGEPITADVNADGLDEILVSVSDGYLYQLRNAPLAAPTEVIDIDPPAGITDRDIDSVPARSVLYGAWQPVQGATSYEVSVSSGGVTVSSPAWQDKGNVTNASVSGLVLEGGTRHEFVVRAKNGTGVSAESVSDGVVVEAPVTMADADIDGAIEADASAPIVTVRSAHEGCSCKVGNRPGAPSLGLLPVLSMLLWRGRRKGRKRRADGA